MKLTNQEQSMVAGLRKRCEYWRTHRKQNLTCLVLFVVLLASGLDYSALPCLPSLNEMSHLNLIKIGVLLFCVGETIRNWNGAPAEVLLLRLVDEATEKNSEPSGGEERR